MAARPLVSVYGAEHFEIKRDEKEAAPSLKMPEVFTAPIRPDIVHFVHTNMAKNKRQAYAVNVGAGHQHSAESWGTGRAVSRIPRVSGGGTSRAGQAAFGNMCRKGRMFAPTKTWRKWHRKINTNQKRYAVASALAASALPALVMARGHKINATPEIPLVVEDALESIKLTKDAIKFLKAVGAYDDVEKCKNSKKLRAGKGKLRDRRHTMRRGPLIVYSEDQGVTRAFRNLPGVEIASVESLNLLQLAPGGHLGRFCIWSKSAFEKMAGIYGSTKRVSSAKKGYYLPHNIMKNSDITRIINSNEIQSHPKLRAPVKSSTKVLRKKNPLKNLGAMIRLNPYALTMRRSELLAQEKRAQQKAAVLEAKRKNLEVKQTKAAKAAAVAKKAHAKAHKANGARLIAE